MYPGSCTSTSSRRVQSQPYCRLRVRLRCSVPLDRLTWPSVVTSARSSFLLQDGLGDAHDSRQMIASSSPPMGWTPNPVRDHPPTEVAQLTCGASIPQRWLHLASPSRGSPSWPRSGTPWRVRKRSMRLDMRPRSARPSGRVACRSADSLDDGGSKAVSFVWEINGAGVWELRSDEGGDLVPDLRAGVRHAVRTSRSMASASHVS